MRIGWSVMGVLLIFCCCAGASPAEESACKSLGEAPDCVGPGVSDMTQCCEGLVPREIISACGRDFGGCAAACLACGDGVCAPELENTCNCPEDCSP